MVLKRFLCDRVQMSAWEVSCVWMCVCVCLEVFADEGDICAHSERFNHKHLGL